MGLSSPRVNHSRFEIEVQSPSWTRLTTGISAENADLMVCAGRPAQQSDLHCESAEAAKLKVVGPFCSSTPKPIAYNNCICKGSFIEIENFSLFVHEDIKLFYKLPD